MSHRPTVKKLNKLHMFQVTVKGKFTIFAICMLFNQAGKPSICIFIHAIIDYSVFWEDSSKYMKLD